MAYLWKVAAALGGKLGPVLIQLSPYARTGGLGLNLVGVRETPADAVGADGACDDRLARERPAQRRPLAAEREHR